MLEVVHVGGIEGAVHHEAQVGGVEKLEAHVHEGAGRDDIELYVLEAAGHGVPDAASEGPRIAHELEDAVGAVPQADEQEEGPWEKMACERPHLSLFLCRLSLSHKGLAFDCPRNGSSTALNHLFLELNKCCKPVRSKCSTQFQGQ